MSCLPGMPCYSNQVTVYPKDCGLNLCEIHNNSTDLVIYTGPNLPCLGVDTCTCMTDILVKINSETCPEKLAMTFLSAIVSNPAVRTAFCNLVNNC